MVESLIYMLWRGIAIGILISAPMGPVGILCIQRTLNRGRLTGLYTGVGAAISDLFYCLLTGFGLSFIEDFIESNQNVIQLLGSAVLIGFGLYLFKKKPGRTLRRPAPDEVDPKKNILGGFLFTFSNPLILFLIIGLFARFNFLIPEIRFYHYIVGFLGICAGCLGWWWLVTFVIDKVRHKFSLHTMLLINRIIGVIILIFAGVGIYTGISNLANATSHRAPPSHSLQLNQNSMHWNKGRGYAPFSHATPEGILLSNATDIPSTDSVALTYEAGGRLIFRVDNRHASPSHRYSYSDAAGITHNRKNPPWGFFITDKEGRKLWVTVSRNEAKDDYDDSGSGSHIAITDGSDGGTLFRTTIKEQVVPFTGESLWNVECNEGKLRIIAGGNEPHQIADVNLQGDNPDGIAAFGFTASPAAEILVSDISFKPLQSIADRPIADIYRLYQETGDVSLISNPKDPVTGFWEIYDRTLDESLLMPGGDYKLAITGDGDRYIIIYIEGARVNKDAWKEGMIKGYLTPSSFPGLYRLEWIDAEGASLSESITAQKGDGNTLTLQFPYHSSVVRLRKVK